MFEEKVKLFLVVFFIIILLVLAWMIFQALRARVEALKEREKEIEAQFIGLSGGVSSSAQPQLQAYKVIVGLEVEGECEEIARFSFRELSACPVRSFAF